MVLYIGMGKDVFEIDSKVMQNKTKNKQDYEKRKKIKQTLHDKGNYRTEETTNRRKKF